MKRIAWSVPIVLLAACAQTPAMDPETHDLSFSEPINDVYQAAVVGLQSLNFDVVTHESDEDSGVIVARRAMSPKLGALEARVYLSGGPNRTFMSIRTLPHDGYVEESLREEISDRLGIEEPRIGT